MKKLVLFISILFVALNFNSCKNDDDQGVIPENIVGTWQWDQEFEDGEENILTACDKQSTIEFFQNGTFTSRDFMEDQSDQCLALDVVNGTWRNLGDSMYELGDLEIIPGFLVDLEVMITFTNNKMTLEYS